MEGQVLNEILQELERRRRSRNINRMLRDISDPFSLPERQFKGFYRLNREAVRDLFNDILQYFEVGRKVTNYQKSVGRDRQSSLSQAAVSNALHAVVDIMVTHLGHRYIKFPTTREEILSVKTGFFEKFNFPGITGCIDGSLIAIFPPPANDPQYPGNVFICRKNFHAINTLIVCDSDLKILAINARYPGSVHDSAVYMMSAVKQLLHNRYLNGDNSTWLLGDSGYPLEPYLLTPIVGAAPETPEGRYTQIHIRTRNCVERCIGTLKSYFRCILKDRVLHYRPPFAAKIIYCCAILHNVMRERNIVDDDIIIVYDDPHDDNHQQEIA